ncbi:hypothetical protein [Streptomyces sp. NPDC005408]
MEESKSELAAQAGPASAKAVRTAHVAQIVDRSSVVRIEDVEDEGP